MIFPEFLSHTSSQIFTLHEYNSRFPQFLVFLKKCKIWAHGWHMQTLLKSELYFSQSGVCYNSQTRDWPTGGWEVTGLCPAAAPAAAWDTREWRRAECVQGTDKWDETTADTCQQTADWRRRGSAAATSWTLLHMTYMTLRCHLVRCAEKQNTHRENC